MKCVSKRELVFAQLQAPAERDVTDHTSTCRGTATRITIDTKMSRANVANNLRALVDEGRAHIAAWTEGSKAAPIYVSGPGVNVPRPRPGDLAYEQEKRRARYQKDKERKQEQRERGESAEPARVVTLRSIEQAKRQPASWLSPIMPKEGA